MGSVPGRQSARQRHRHYPPGDRLDRGGHDVAFDLSRRVHKALDGLSGENFNGLSLVETNTNHNHEEILESIDSYAVRYLLR